MQVWSNFWILERLPHRAVTFFCQLLSEEEVMILVRNKSLLGCLILTFAGCCVFHFDSKSVCWLLCSSQNEKVRWFYSNSYVFFVSLFVSWVVGGLMEVSVRVTICYLFVCRCFGQSASKLGYGIHGPQRMILCDFGDSLTCHLAPTSGRNIHRLFQ